MNKKAMTWSMVLGVVTGLLLLVVLLSIYGSKILYGQREASAMVATSQCYDKHATAKDFFLRIQQFAPRHTITGADNPLYEGYYSPEMALDEYISYHDCRYREKLWGNPTDPGKDQAEKDIHKKVVTCGEAALINYYMDCSYYAEKSKDAGERKVYENKMRAIKQVAPKLKFKGSLKDLAAADKCKFDPEAD